MTTPSLFRPFARLLAGAGTARTGATNTPGARRRSARRAVWCGAALFALATAGLALAAETVKPEWRDPEYGHRLRQARRWKAKRPARPFVLFVGSSRLQYGMSPADMEFPDKPGSPLVYNLGYRGAHPIGVWLQLTRALDDGLAPRAVVIQIAPLEIRYDDPADPLFVNWAPRLGPADLKRLAPYLKDPEPLRQQLNASRRDPWAAHRTALLSDLLPTWQTYGRRHDHRSWEEMSYGFSPLYPEDVNDDFRRGTRDRMPATLALINDLPVGALSARAIRAIVARCRAENIPVAACWAPESAGFRALYTPAGRAIRDQFERDLVRDVGVPVFPEPTHLDEDDFADGFHLLRDGAAKYSLWLADNHLKPWLAEVLK